MKIEVNPTELAKAIRKALSIHALDVDDRVSELLEELEAEGDDE